jgi:hypothetical protein
MMIDHHWKALARVYWDQVASRASTEPISMASGIIRINRIEARLSHHDTIGGKSLTSLPSCFTLDLIL